jgi:hypothetical protein
VTGGNPFKGNIDGLRQHGAEMLGEQHMAATKAGHKAARRNAEPFDKFPRWWTLRMKDASVGAFKIALLLLHLDWKSGGRPFVVSDAAAEDRGVGHRRKVSAVLELESLGIIRVERRHKKSSLITVLLSQPVVTKRT